MIGYGVLSVVDDWVSYFERKISNHYKEQENARRSEQEKQRAREQQAQRERMWREERRKREERKQWQERSRSIPFGNDKQKHALQIFGFSDSQYTQEQLNKKWKELMKKNHPDNGGSEAKAKEINDAYDVLNKKFKG